MSWKKDIIFILKGVGKRLLLVIGVVAAIGFAALCANLDAIFETGSVHYRRFVALPGGRLFMFLISSGGAFAFFMLIYEKITGKKF